MKLTLRVKLLAAFGVVLFLMLISVSVVSFRLTRASHEQAQIKDVRYPSIMAAAQIQYAAAQASAALRGYVLFGSDPNDATRFKAERQASIAQIQSAIDQMHQLRSQLGGDEAIGQQTLETKVKQYIEVQDNVERIALDGNPNDAGRAYDILKNEAAASKRDVDAAISKYLTDEQQNTSAEMSAIVSASQHSQTLLWLVTLLAVGAGSAVILLFVRRLVDTLNAVVTRSGAIAAGDLTGEPIEVHDDDEIGALATSINNMQSRLQTVIGEMHGVSRSLTDSAGQIASASSQQAQSSEQEKDQTTQVATAIQEMFSTVSQVSENSSQAADAAQKAASTAQKGGDIVSHTRSQMEEIAQGVGEMASKIAALGKSSDQIGKIAGVIDDIADQTNLLALNAAIEAARAGEQGRGFAVVADEVRKLAERTASATREIAGMIESIQHETRDAVTEMEKRSRQVNEGVASTVKAGDSLKEIIHMAEHVGEMITQIAIAAHQQTAATEDMSHNVEHIAELVRTSAQNSQQTALSCGELNEMASNLQSVVHNFKIDKQLGVNARREDTSWRTPPPTANRPSSVASLQ